MKPVISRPGVTRETERRNCYRIGSNQRGHGKYEGCEYVDAGDRREVRKLSRAEIEEFKRVINLRINGKERAAGVRFGIASADHTRASVGKVKRDLKRTSAVSRRAIV